MSPQGEYTDYTEDGVDMSLIRWMLSLTPAERLGVLDDFANFVAETRQRNARTELPENSDDAPRSSR